MPFLSVTDYYTPKAIYSAFTKGEGYFRAATQGRPYGFPEN